MQHKFNEVLLLCHGLEEKGKHGQIWGVAETKMLPIRQGSVGYSTVLVGLWGTAGMFPCSA